MTSRGLQGSQQNGYMPIPDYMVRMGILLQAYRSCAKAELLSWVATDTCFWQRLRMGQSGPGTKGKAGAGVPPMADRQAAPTSSTGSPLTSRCRSWSR